MLARSLPVLSILFSFSYHALGHAIITPALGVFGTAARSDVTRTSDNSPCGNGVNVANAVGGSSAVQANGNSFTITVTNFNGGRDGSTKIADSTIDPSGTGNSFNGGSVAFTQNGEAAPSTTGSIQISATLPSGTTCTGGDDGASCLVSFTTAGGFGNCVLISQGNDATMANTTSSTNDTTAAASRTTRTGRNCETKNNANAAICVQLATVLRLTF